MAEETVMLRVYPQDAARLAALFGGPTHKAFRKLLTANCQHPEGARQYTAGMVPSLSGVMMEDEKPVMVSGFYCHECRRYVFQGMGAEVGAGLGTAESAGLDTPKEHRLLDQRTRPAGKGEMG